MDTPARQTTIDEAERTWHIARLERSMERWRERDLDRILPDEYARYMALLDHLKAGGAYTVRQYRPEAMIEMSRAERKADPVGRMFHDIGAGLAHVSRTYRLKRCQ